MYQRWETFTTAQAVVYAGRVTLTKPPAEARVVAVHRSPTHSFHKPAEPAIRLVAGLGVDGDAHSGVTVKHRSRVAKDPSQPNLRQVHLIHEELHDALRAQGFAISPGDMGENITTAGIDLLALPTGTQLYIGGASIEVTGLRNPCLQLDRFQDGLMQACLDRDEDRRTRPARGCHGNCRGGRRNPAGRCHSN